MAARGEGLAPHVAGWAPSSGAYLNSWLRRRLGRGRRLEGRAALQVPAAPGRTGRPSPSKPARLRGHRARPGQPWAPSVLCRGGREARSRSGSAPFSKMDHVKFLKSCLKVNNIVYSNISRPRENPTSVNGEKARCVRRPRVDFGRLHAGPAFGRLGAAPPIPTRFAGPNIPSRRVRRGSARNITAAGRRRCSRRSPAATLRAPCLRRDDPPTQQQRPRRSTSRWGVGRPPDKPASALPRHPPVRGDTVSAGKYVPASRRQRVMAPAAAPPAPSSAASGPAPAGRPRGRFGRERKRTAAAAHRARLAARPPLDNLIGRGRRGCARASMLLHDGQAAGGDARAHQAAQARQEASPLPPAGRALGDGRTTWTTGRPRGPGGRPRSRSAGPRVSPSDIRRARGAGASSRPGVRLTLTQALAPRGPRQAPGRPGDWLNRSGPFYTTIGPR